MQDISLIFLYWWHESDRIFGHTGLHIIHASMLSHFSHAQLFVTLWTVEYQALLSIEARILEWVAISFSRRSSWPRDQTHVSCIGRRILYCWASREAPLGDVACYILSPPFRAFATSFQGLNFESKDRNKKVEMKDHWPRNLASHNGFDSSCHVIWTSVLQKARNVPKSIEHSAQWKFCHVWLFETPWTIQFMEFSRPEYWSG